MIGSQEIIKNIKDAVAAGNTTIKLLEKQQKDVIHPHVWEHGDVFVNGTGTRLICIKKIYGPIRVFCCGMCTGHTEKETAFFLNVGRFLFNIREKL